MDEMDDWSSDDDTIEGNDADHDSDVELYSESEDSGNEKRKFPGDGDFIPTRAPSLEKIASASIAIALCSHAKNIVTKFEQATTEGRKSLFDEMFSWPSQLSLPTSLMEYVRNHFFDVLENLLIWLSNHRTEMFLKKDAYEFDLPRVMHFIEWHPNGAINDLKTAINLLKSDQLSDLEKYRLACTYCLKEEIEKLWHVLVAKEPPSVVGFPFLHPLVGYWNLYFADQLHKVPKPAHLTIDEFMVRNENVFNWAATEYFFDRLSPEDQIDCVVHFIDEDYVIHQKLLLTKLNESQRLHVYIKRSIRIIRNYLHCGGVDINELDAVLTWYEVREMFTKAQFWSLIKTLCRIRARDEVVMEIWTSSSDELRNHVLNFDRYNLINETLRWCIHKRDFGYGFFIVVLQNAHQAPSKWPDEQKKLFFEYYKRLLIDVLDIWDPEPEQCVKFRAFMDNTIFPGDLSKTLMTRHEFLKLDRFLNYMYPADLPEFRPKARDLLLENFKYIDEYCMKFYSDGNVKGLNAALAPLRSSFPELILEFKKNLLFSKQGIEVCYTHFDSTSDVFTEIVSDGFSDGKLAAEFGREIIFSNRGLDRLQNLIRDKNIPNEIAKRNVNLLLKSNEDVRKLKKCLLYPKQSLRASYTHFDSTTNVLTEIVSNGLPNSKAAFEFGRKIIFSNQGIRKLHNLIRDRNFPNEIVKKNVNLFLESNEDRRKFKTKLILSMPRDLNADTKAKKKYFRILSVLF